MENPDDKQKDSGFSSYSRAMRSAGPLFGAGIQLAASVVLMFFAGKWLDDTFASKPWLMFCGIIFGLIAGMYNFLKIVNKVERDRTKK